MSEQSSRRGVAAVTLLAVVCLITIGCLAHRGQQATVTVAPTSLPPDLPRDSGGVDLDERKREFFETMMREVSTVAPRSVPLRSAGGDVPQWAEQGPAPMLNGQIENVTPSDQVQGAVHTVLAHPTDPDVLYVGAVNGGIWRTTDARAPMPTWVPLTDGRPTLSIGALEFDPTDPTFRTLIAGLGRFSSYGSAGGFLGGLLRSTDGGATWTQFSDPLLVGQNFASVAARGPVLLAASNSAFGGGGLFRSADTGTSWNQVALEGGVTPFVADLIGDSLDPDRFYLTAGGGPSGSGVYTSDDAGQTWTAVSRTDLELSGAFNAFDGSITTAELALTTTGRLYTNVLVRGRPRYIGYSDNPDSLTPTWTRMDVPVMIERTARALDDATNAAPIEISLPDGTVVEASNATPIVIATAAPHGLNDADDVFVSGVVGNQAANGTFDVNVIDATSFLLQESEGDGDYVSGGTWRAVHGLSQGDQVLVEGVSGNTAANGLFLVSTAGTSEFTLVGSTGNGPYLGGGSWVEVDGANPRDKPGAQGFLHTSIAVDPVDPNVVYIGGDRQSSPFPNSVGAVNFSGRLFRGDAARPRGPNIVPSPQWDHLTNSNAIAAVPGGGTSDGSSPHADSREMTFDAAGDLIETSDGGIYRRMSPGDNTGVWTSLAGTLSVTEFHDIAYDTVANVLIGGTQDNNNSVQVAPGSMTWDNEGFSGDGGDIETARLGPNLSVRYGSAQFLFGFQRRVYDADNVLLSIDYPALLLGSGKSLIEEDPGRGFVQDLELNVIDPTRGITGTRRLYETFDQFETLTDVSGDLGLTINGLAYGGVSQGTPNPDLIVFQAGDVLRRTTAGGEFAPVGSYPGSRSRDLVLDPDDGRNIFVADTADRVWRTDETDTWVEVTGDLSIGELRAIDYVASIDFDRVIVGGRDGVYAMRTDLPGVWTELGVGLPRAPVFDLDYDPEDSLLAAATLGRGAWLLPVEACAAENDGDSVCDTVDNCLALANPDQLDADTDGYGDACDCAPDDAAAFAVPSVIDTLSLVQAAPGSAQVTLSWGEPALAGGTPMYEVVTSTNAQSLALAPVFEACLAAVSVPTTTDDTLPADVLFYLVRAFNGCGAGSLGETSSGADRAPGGVCP